MLALILRCGSDCKTNLVHHHYREKIRKRAEEERVHVVLGGVADGLTELVKNNLSKHKSQHAEEDMEQWPALLKCPDDEYELHDNIDGEE